MRTSLVRLIPLAAAIVVASAPASEAQAPPPLQEQARSIVEGVSGEWGAVAWSLDRNEVLFSINPHQVLVPASTNKIFTTVWALDRLGPDFRFHTDLLATGAIEDGTLRGDLFLRGSGDPSFGYPDFTEDTMDPLRIMARRLAERGVRRVDGAVFGDGSAFDTTYMAAEWPASAAGGSADYAPRISGLAFQRNVVTIRVGPGNGETGLRLTPAVREVPVVNQTRAGGGRTFAVRHPDGDTIFVRGGVPARGTDSYRVGVSQPVLMAAAALHAALTEAGIEVRGRAREGRAPEEAKLVHRHVSIPLSAMLAKVNRDSDNFFAEQIFRATAFREAGLGSFSRGGSHLALHMIQHGGAREGEVYPADGSGLSRLNRTSAHALLSALIHAQNQPWRDEFMGSLAVAGNPGGTMRRMFRGTPGEGRILGKTGFINRVRGLVGYAPTADDERVAFVFLYNGGNASGARNAQIDLGNLLAEYRRGAPPPAVEENDDDADDDG